MDKKGVLGLDTAKAVFIFFLILAILAIAILLTLSSLRDPVESLDKTTEIIDNETLTTVTETGESLSRLASDTYRKSSCAIRFVTNGTGGGETIPSTNYTLSNNDCTFTFTGAQSSYNDSDWNVSYTATYSNPETNYIVQNISSALTDNFFNQTGTIFAILIVVIIILAIGIIIAVVMRFGGGSGMGSSGGSSTSNFGSDTVMGV